jgi:predicted Rossmann fold flavoprotein
LQSFDVIVIGAGPAGLLAAGEAARTQSVLLLEKMEKPARKLCITGKGRCNLTNNQSWDEWEPHIFPVARAFRPAFMNFPNTALMRFMEEIGAPTVVERGGRVFPASSRAQEVAGALVRWAKKNRVTIRCHAVATRLIEDNHRISAVEVLHNGRLQTLSARAFIVATGGLSYPATGATGDGFRMAAETGHTITPLRPSLVALTVAHPSLPEPVTLRNVSVALRVDGSLVDEEFGEMIFSGATVDGPVVLRLSQRAVDALRNHQKVEIQLNCKPALRAQQIQARLQRERAEFPELPVAALLRKWLPQPLVPPFMSKIGWRPTKKAAQLDTGEIAQMVATLQSWTMNVSGYGGYERAVVTAGGVSMKDIDTKTMRSRKIDNLFFAGEVLDLNADTGGYNLQIAFSTGYLAGKTIRVKN